MNVRVKICGITNVEDALFCVEAGADALGFNFYHKSLRFIDTSKCEEIISRLPPFVSRVGVFVNEEPDVVRGLSETLNLDYLQFHGNESPEYCRMFGKKAIKVFRIQESMDFENYCSAAAFLFDSPHEGGFGGTGKSFDWGKIKEMRALTRPVILSGGLGLDNIEKAIKQVRPYAVDVCSRLESGPGKKNPAWIRDFVVKAKGVKI